MYFLYMNIIIYNTKPQRARKLRISDLIYISLLIYFMRSNKKKVMLYLFFYFLVSDRNFFKVIFIFMCFEKKLDFL